jgi:hypothetical protein
MKIAATPFLFDEQMHLLADRKIYVKKANYHIVHRSPIMYAQFFMPDYSNKEVKNNKMPDPRNTIFWNGDKGNCKRTSLREFLHC